MIDTPVPNEHTNPPLPPGAKPLEFQPSGESIRQSVYQAIVAFRQRSGGRGLQINVNLQNMAQYLADRLQSGEGAGLLQPAETRDALTLAKLCWWTGEAVDVIVVAPWDGAYNSLMDWLWHAARDRMTADAQEHGVGIGGGRLNLWAVIALGRRANMAAETRTGAVRLVSLNEFFNCDGPALLTEEGGTHP